MKNDRLKDFISLTKPRLNLLAIFTTLAGFYMGSAGPLNGRLLLFTLLGSVGVAAGCGVLNQWFEVESDGRMNRTKSRPLPAGRLPSRQAFWFGLVLSVVGLWILLYQVNELTSYLGMTALVSYIVFYTPLKKITSLCTVVGAIPGAMPPLMGYAAVQNQIGFEGWTLFSILFFWQMPHFLSIGWIYREDYAKAGFPMLSVIDPEGETTGWVAVVYAMALLPISLLPTYLKMTGPVYFWIALVLSLFFLWFSAGLVRMRTLTQARKLFLVSIIYLPLLFIAMALNKI